MRTRNGPSPSSAAASCGLREITAYDDPHELTLDELKQLNPDFESKYTEYGDAAIVVVSRVGGEAGAYYPARKAWQTACTPSARPQAPAVTTARFLQLCRRKRWHG